MSQNIRKQCRVICTTKGLSFSKCFPFGDASSGPVDKVEGNDCCDLRIEGDASEGFELLDARLQLLQVPVRLWSNLTSMWWEKICLNTHVCAPCAL